MKIRIRHRTTYNYSQPVSFGQHKIMVRPREGMTFTSKAPSWKSIRPTPSGGCGTSTATASRRSTLPRSASQLSFYSEVILQQYDTNPLDFILEEERGRIIPLFTIPTACRN